MDLPFLTYRGAPLDDVELLDVLPPALCQLLAQRNGFVALRGGIHVRGAARAPAWHALRPALEGPGALHRLLPGLVPGDVPFAQDAVGDQFLVREGAVWRWHARDASLAPVAPALLPFLEALGHDPWPLVATEALLAFERAGGVLRPGELLDPDAGRAVPALERLRALAAPRAPAR